MNSSVYIHRHLLKNGNLLRNEIALEKKSIQNQRKLESPEKKPIKAAEHILNYPYITGIFSWPL